MMVVAVAVRVAVMTVVMPVGVVRMVVIVVRVGHCRLCLTARL